ncbi:hypothetical protein [Marisediminicola senii]|uniref:hypothetical protein n=1 Tax=Marisediminicola senii TaxID=2711233 RepID=UPI0013E9F591|nr:hypothetical protein [Marisediminicola senii]
MTSDNAPSTGTPYWRARTNPEYRAAVRAAYTGHTDLDDALWWYSAPTEPTPGGIPSPLLHLRELEYAVYSVPETSEQWNEKTAALLALHQRIDVERTAITSAVAAAEAAEAAEAAAAAAAAATAVQSTGSRGPAPTEESETEAPKARGDGAEPATHQTGDHPAGAAKRRTRWRRALVALAIALAFAAGFASAEFSMPLAAPVPFDDAEREVVALEIFDEPQDDEDRAGIVSYAAAIDPETVRAYELVEGPDLYVARDELNRVCLSVSRDPSEITFQCTSEGMFATTGLAVHDEFVEDGEFSALTYFWDPRGGLSITSSVG